MVKIFGKKTDSDQKNSDSSKSEIPLEFIAKENNGAWPTGDYEEGQLSLDVYQTPKALIIKSTIAGVRPEDLNISIDNDMLTIRGKRESNIEANEEDYLFKECYWGSFSRSLILPVEIKANKIDASIKNGVLTIVLPKANQKDQTSSIKVKAK